MEDSSLSEVWCESHDDITLIWNTSEVVVEFVQVKSNDLPSRWSLARLRQRVDSRLGSSILEQSLLRARCKEAVRFRLVTQAGVSSELAVLRLAFDHPGRTAASLAPMAQGLDRNLAGVSAENGMTAADWANHCYWDVRGTEEAVTDRNKLR